jgi:cysteine desulfurase
MTDPVYLDYAATTPVDPMVAQAMTACLEFNGNFGNPASRSHVYGWRAEEAVEIARADVATLIGADPREIIWTSGATESDNLALKGVTPGASRKHIITCIIEHKAIVDTCKYLETQGFEVTWLKPAGDGTVSPQAVAAALRPDTLIVSIMHANNELGVLNDIAGIGAVCRANGTLFHSDAAQSFGKAAIDVRTMPIDLLSISGHKIYGPKGAGVLYVRREPPVRLQPMIHGGGHEFGMRSGTLATHQVVGLGTAARLMAERMLEENARLTRLRNRLLGHLLQIPDTVLHGADAPRLPGIVNVGFGGVDGETLLLALDDLAVSSGSACTSASVEPSFVLRGIGVPDELAHASVRFSVGRFTSDQDIEHAGRRVAEVVGRLRLSPD